MTRLLDGVYELRIAESLRLTQTVQGRITETDHLVEADREAGL